MNDDLTRHDSVLATKGRPPSVLVTGSSSGFGAGICLSLAERGYTVYASMRNLAKQTDLLAAAQQRNLPLRILPLDVTDKESIRSAMDTIVTETGGLYGIVNNAGFFLRGFFEDMLDEEIRHIFDVNVFGVMDVTRAALPYMRAGGCGRVIVISSVAGKITAPAGSIYGASRFAQEGFAESLRQELEPLGIYVSLIEPGITNTETWTIDKTASARANDPASPYLPWFRSSEQLFYRTMNSSPIRVQHVAEVVHRALSAPRPRLRYMVGWRAKLVVALRRYIPGEIFDRFYFGQVVKRLTRPI